jgi:pseudo-rSAM protein
MPSANRDKSFWLYLEPWVHVTAGSGQVLFYNTLNKKSLHYNGNIVAGNLAALFRDPENGYVVKVSSTEIEGTELGKIIGDLRKTLMGDLLETNWSEGKPVNILPKPFIKNKLTKNVFDNPDDLSLVNYDEYIHEVTIFLNTGPSAVVNAFPLASLQFPFPGRPSQSTESFDFEVLNTLAIELSVFKLITINFTGSDLNDQENLLKVASLFREFTCEKKFHIPVTGFNRNDFNELIHYPSLTFAFYITFPFDISGFNEIVTLVSESAQQSRFEFHFVVKDNEELQTSLEIIETSKLTRYSFNPYYDGKNFDFFRENVFITQEDIKKSKPDQHEIFSRLTFNEKDFGKFTILPGGKVFANLNDPEVGNFPKNSIVDLIIKEALSGKSWKRTRPEQYPCMDCINHFLCPPVSSYEILMKRYNFCDIFKNSGNP